MSGGVGGWKGGRFTGLFCTLVHWQELANSFAFDECQNTGVKK